MSDTEPQSRIGSIERVRPVPDRPVDTVLSLQAPVGDYEAGIRDVRPIGAIWSALVGHSSAPASVAIIRSASISNAHQIAPTTLKSQAAWRNPYAEAKLNPSSNAIDEPAPPTLQRVPDQHRRHWG